MRPVEHDQCDSSRLLLVVVAVAATADSTDVDVALWDSRISSVSSNIGWFHGSAVARWSLTSELSLSCARLTADG